MEAFYMRKKRKAILDLKRKRLQQDNPDSRDSQRQPLTNITNISSSASYSENNDSIFNGILQQRSTMLNVKSSTLMDVSPRCDGTPSGNRVLPFMNHVLENGISSPVIHSEAQKKLFWSEKLTFGSSSNVHGASQQCNNHHLPRLTELSMNLSHVFDSVCYGSETDVSEKNDILSNTIVDVVPHHNTPVNNEFYCSHNQDIASTLTEEWQYYGPVQDAVDYEDLGDPECECKWCGATFWRAEALRTDSSANNIIFPLCCGKGKVQLSYMSDPPIELHNLFFGADVDSSKFMDNIRCYNTCFAFTSMGGKIDRSVNKGGGRYSFRLSGQNHHRIGSLLPVGGQSAKFAQLYIYDTQNETTNRMTNFSGGRLGLDQAILDKIKDCLDAHNVFARSFRMARDQYEVDNAHKLQLRLVRTRRRDGRRYNLPSTDEVAGLIVGDVDTTETHRDIIIEHQSGMLQRIDELHPSYLPLQYPLLFPYGEDGYREDVGHSESSLPNSRKQNRLTMRQWFAFRLQERQFEISILLYARRLLQQFIVDGYTMIESSRLRYLRQNQKKLRADLYKGVVDAVDRGVTSADSVGKRIILPSSFTGGPRYMIQHYQDSMAICRWTGYPHIFITFTCNPKWPELRRFVTERGVQSEDRPDIVARVFKMKLLSLLKDLRAGKIFGQVKAVVYTTEFQKRGLPHCHILLFLANYGMNWASDDIDKFISVEIPDKSSHPDLYKAVQEFMVHGPCGDMNDRSPCMLNSICSKFYPRDFNDETYINDDGFPVYKRRDDHRFVSKGDFSLSNQWIVPYNPYILLKYQSHINVEWCNQSSAVKYLFKYINKGSDRVTTVLSDADEIKAFLDCRYISACEAAWRIFSFEIHFRHPAVIRLSIHMPNEQSVLYGDDDDLEDVVSDIRNTKSIFLAWMEANRKYPDIASSLTYAKFPMFFTYKSQNREWVPRKTGLCVGCVLHIPYNAGELYYLSMLVCKSKGPKCYEDIRTINGIVYNTFKEACYALGILDDDNEFVEAINEAAVWGSASYLRRLFVAMLLSNSLSEPSKVWYQTWKHLCDDVVYQQQRLLNRRDMQFTEEQIQNFGLNEIEKLLESNGRSLSDYPDMPTFVFDASIANNNQFIVDQLNYDRTELAYQFSEMEAKLTDEQRYIFRLIVDAVDDNDGGLFFVYGYGGTGKTFLWNVLTSYLRSNGNIVLNVASSGIAATLLPGGRTAHSRFCIPLDITDDSTCNIIKGSPLAELLIETKLIIWDEAPMVKRQCFEALDRTMRDIMQGHHPNAESLPFGGKCVVLGGDFRQILPVIKNGNRSDVVHATINSSYLWSHCRVLTLTQNMRLQSHLGEKDANELNNFAQWILDIGDGKLGLTNDGVSEVDIPEEFLLNEFEDPLKTLVDYVFPDFLSNYNVVDYLKDRAILAPRVETVLEVNNYMQSIIPGEEKIYLSADRMINDGSEGGSFAQYHSIDYLNTISASGLPNHELKLKVGVPVMLLRNIDQAAGLCNGTRLIITHLGEHVLAGKVISGGNIGQIIFLPRMNTSLSDSTLPFKFQRRQFPVSISYCMTINKSQGQTLATVGIYLPKPVFSHGQLYVAISRVKYKSGLKIMIHNKHKMPLCKAVNVVYLEVYDNI